MVNRSTLKHLDSLQVQLKGLTYNIDKLCDYDLKTLTTFTNAGGNDIQAFDKFYEAFKLTPNA